MAENTIKIPADIKKLKFEDAMGELEQITRLLEQDSQGLDESIEAWSRAMALRSHCENLLEKARLKVEKIIPQEGGNLKLTDLDEV